MENDKVFRMAFLISFGAHCFILGAPGMSASLSKEKEVEQKEKEIAVTFDVERQALLPKIETIGEEKKVKLTEENTSPQQPEKTSQASVEQAQPKDAKEVNSEPVPIDRTPSSLVKETEEASREKNKEGFKTTQPSNESMLRYQDAIKQRIEAARRYPVWAKSQGIEGIVHVSFVVSRGGQAHGVQMTGSSGSKILDEEALSTINRATPFPPFPEDLHSASARIDVAVVFSLQDNKI